MRAVILILATVLLITRANACLWVTGTKKDGVRTNRGTHPQLLINKLQRSLQTDPAEEGRELESETVGQNDYSSRNDHAAALIMQGRAQEAIPLLLALEAERPDQYVTAANLGTAYELAGNNAEAKRWIERGMELNFDSHYQTEWLHALILDAKLRQEKSTNYFAENTVLNLDYTQLDKGRNLTIAGQQRSVEDVRKALEYQLSERLQFVKTPDFVVASLLFDFAMLQAGVSTLESAIPLLQMAAQFGYPHSRIDPLIKQYQQTITRAHIWHTAKITTIAFAVIAAIAYALKKRWITLRRSKAASQTCPLSAPVQSQPDDQSPA